MNRNTLIIIGINAVFILGVLAVAFLGTGGLAPQPEESPEGMPTGSFVLALSWEPAFCETQPRVPECQAQTSESLDARQFSLHGLWPEGSYCGVDDAVRAADERHDWDALPEVTLTAQTRAALDEVMPGTLSHLDRHEWIKHGTCSGISQQSYFEAALALTEAVNSSSLPDLFTDALGDSLSAMEIADALDADFGPGTSQKASLDCVTDGSRRLISGIRFSLEGMIGTDPDLGALVAGADPRISDCGGGIVDPAGLQ